MPNTEHLAKCIRCNQYFRTGDCIPEKCPACDCAKSGHLWIALGRRQLCAQCGVSTGLEEHQKAAAPY